MEKLPRDINSIKNNCGIFISDGFRYVNYKINEGEKSETTIETKVPYYERKEISNKVVDDSNQFINGFKVIQTINNDYGYIREKDNKLLHFRYDVATNFNKYGFAMVARDGYVSWINKNFQYLDYNGEMIIDNIQNGYSTLKGWTGVYNFSDNSIPLSRLCNDKVYGNTVYFDTNGNLKEFLECNGKDITNSSLNVFRNGSDFNKNNQASSYDYFLLAKGIYISRDTVLKLAEEKGFIDSIGIDANKSLEKVKALKKRK